MLNFLKMEDDGLVDEDSQQELATPFNNAENGSIN